MSIMNSPHYLIAPASDEKGKNNSKKYSPGVGFYIALNICAAGLLLYFYDGVF
jgi:hypothetical protein